MAKKPPNKRSNEKTTSKLKPSRKTSRRERKKQTGIRKWLNSPIFWGLGAVVVLALGYFLTQVNRASLFEGDLDSVTDTSIEFDSLGREHIEQNEEHIAYNSNPPTSGPHYTSPARTDVYRQPLPDEQLIHNLEHGHIWLSYKSPDDNEAIQLFTRLQAEAPRSIIVTYRPENDSRITVAAWTRLLNLDELDEDQIRAFFDRYFDKAPESVAG